MTLQSQSLMLEQEQEASWLDTRQLFVSLYRHKWMILILGLVFAIASAFYAYSLVPEYQARATLLIDAEDSSIASAQDIYASSLRGYEYRQTQYELLRSRNLAERVVRKLELHKDPRFGSPAKAVEESPEGFLESLDLSFLRPAMFSHPAQPVRAPTDEERVQQHIANLTSMIQGGIAVTPVEDSHFVELGFRSEDAEFAATVVNTLADQYIESLLDARLDATRRATEWLTQRLADLRENLGVSDQRLQAFREDEKLVDMQGITTLGAQQIAELSMKVSAAREKRINAENIMREVDRLGGSTTEELLTMPVIQRHELISDIKKTESDIQRRAAELGKRYGVKHPRMIAINSELKSIQEELAAEVGKVVTGIDREYQLALRTEESLREQLEEAKEEYRQVNRKEFEFQELQRELDTNRELYDMFFTRMKETTQTSGFERANARVVDQAVVPTSPVSPNHRMIILSGVMGGILFGSILAVALGIMDNTVKMPEDVKTRLNAALLGALPMQKAGKTGYMETYWENPQSIFAEAVRTVRTSLILSGLDSPLKVIVITSSIPGEGKSAVAVNLGAAFSQMERTLVIGADLRRPTLASKCGISPKHPGLSNYVAGSAELDECIVNFELDGLYIMPSGIIPPNPLEMLGSRKFREAMDHLAERFDRIIIDSAPLQAVSDALILASYADSLIYVVKADYTSASIARRGIERLSIGGVPLTGVILNAVDFEKNARFYGGEGYSYGGYYQASESAPVRA